MTQRHNAGDDASDIEWDDYDDAVEGAWNRDATRAHIDDGLGSAAMSSTDDWVRANHRPPDHDGRSPTRTYFDPRDVSGKYPPWQSGRDKEDRRSWRTLANWQDGVQSDISRSGQNWWADKQRWVDTFAGKLYANDHHVDRCKHILEHLDATPYQSAHIPMELVIIGVLSLLIDADIDDFDNRTLAREHTKGLLADLDASVGDYENVRRLLRENDSELLFPE